MKRSLRKCHSIFKFLLLTCSSLSLIIQVNIFILDIYLYILQFHKVFHLVNYTMVLRHALLLGRHVAIREHHAALLVGLLVFRRCLLTNGNMAIKKNSMAQYTVDLLIFTWF